VLLFQISCSTPPTFSAECVRASPEQVRILRVPEEDVERNLERAESRNRRRREVLRDLFESSGCTGDRLVDKSIGGSRLPNLSCTLPGRTKALIVVGAHFDKVRHGDGVIDNWTGAALLPSLFRSLAKAERHHSFEFVGFSAEEVGLIGSKSFVDSLDDVDRARIRAMVNLDTLGLGPVRVEANHSDEELVCYFFVASRTTALPVHALTFGRGLTSDFEPFMQAGIPVVDFSSYRRGWSEILHTRRDTLAAVDRAAYYESYRVLAVYLALLDGGLARNGGALEVPPLSP
jgi:hypothetical protein